MTITLRNVMPLYMSEPEVSGSDIYLQPEVVFEQGRSYMVSAKSGHGKTSLLNFIYGINHNYRGEIVIDAGVSDIQTMRQTILSFMFQDLSLFPELTALENVQLKNSLTNYKSDEEIKGMLDELLPPEKKHQPVATLSLGQRQRVAAVRALCQPFRFLLLDEPFSHIDHDTAVKVSLMIRREVERQGAGMIVTALDPIDMFPFDNNLNL